MSRKLSARRLQGVFARVFGRAKPVSAGYACFAVSAMQGGVLSVEAGAPGRLILASGADAAMAVVAVLFDAWPHLCFLLAQDGRRISLQGDEICGPVLSLRSLRTDKAGYVRLRHPLGEQGFLTADTAEAGTAGPVAVRLLGKGITLQAVFCLTPLPEAGAAALRGLVAACADAAGRGLGAAAMLDGFRTRRIGPDLAEALLRAMPRDELAELGRRLLHHPDDLAALRRALPADPWLNTRLPALIGWNATRTQPAALASPASEEALVLPIIHRPGLGTPIPAGLALLTLARRHVLPRGGACVLATARNEGAYLLDWIAYHRSIGFAHIFFYSNENQDGSDELLALLTRHGAISWIDNGRGPQAGPQEKAYAHALALLPQILDYGWAAVLDLDEYLAFDTAMFDGVGDFLALQEAQTVDAIALCWAMFVGLPGQGWSDAPTASRFTRRQLHINRHVKSIFRPRQFWHAQPHYPFATFGAPFDFRTQDGGVHHHPGVRDRIPAFAEQPAANQAWVNHYMLRSAPEAAWKWARGRANWLSLGSDRQSYMAFIARTFLDFAKPETLVEDRRILACARGQAAELERLRALPGVAACEADIRARFAIQLRAAGEEFVAAALGQDDKRVTHFRAILAASLSS